MTKSRTLNLKINNNSSGDFPGGPVANNSPAKAGDTGSLPGLGRSPLPWGNQAHVPQLLKPSLQNPCSLIREVIPNEQPVHCSEYPAQP